MADDTPPPEPPSPPDGPSPDPMALFRENEDFKAEVLRIADKIANLKLRPVEEAVAKSVAQQYTADLKKKIIKEQLGGVEEFASLLPDVSGYEAMEEAVRKLKMKLHVALRGDIRPTVSSLRQERPPTAAQLIQYGLQVREQIRKQNAYKFSSIHG